MVYTFYVAVFLQLFACLKLCVYSLIRTLGAPLIVHFAVELLVSCLKCTLFRSIQVISPEHSFTCFILSVNLQVLCLNYNHIESVTGKSKTNHMINAPHAKITHDDSEFNSPLLEKLEVLHLGLVVVFFSFVHVYYGYKRIIDSPNHQSMFLNFWILFSILRYQFISLVVLAVPVDKNKTVTVKTSGQLLDNMRLSKQHMIRNQIEKSVLLWLLAMTIYWHPLNLVVKIQFYFMLQPFTYCRLLSLFTFLRFNGISNMASLQLGRLRNIKTLFLQGLIISFYP